MIEKKLNILMIGFDWRNIFEHDYNQLIEKLERDCLNPEFNNFFIFDWSTKTYYKKIIIFKLNTLDQFLNLGFFVISC